MVFYIGLAIIFVIILIFSSKSLSPIPYFPSQKIDLPLIIKALNLQNNQTVFDLGAGDGIVIFEAAKKAYQQGLNTKFIAVEINPILILILHLRRLFNPNKNNIEVVYGDMFKMNFSRHTFHATRYTFYLYISPWFIEKTLKNIKKQVKKFRVVSYMYPIKSFGNKERIIVGKNRLFFYS